MDSKELKWISVYDKLPKLNENVIVSYQREDESSAVTEAFVTKPFIKRNGKWVPQKSAEYMWHEVRGQLKINVTHWQPKPNPVLIATTW